MSRSTAPVSPSCSTAPASRAPTARATTASGISRCCSSCRTSASPCRATPSGCARSCARPSRSATRRRSSASPRAASAPTCPPLERLADGVDVLVALRRAGRPASSASARWRTSPSTSPSACAPRASARPSSTRAGSCRCSRRSCELAASHRLVITIEDGIRVGGIGTRVRQVLREAGVDTAVDELGVPDEFIDHASREQILEDAGLTAAKIAQDVVAQVLGTRIPVARPATSELPTISEWAARRDG